MFLVVYFSINISFPISFLLHAFFFFCFMSYFTQNNVLSEALRSIDSSSYNGVHHFF